MSPKRQSRSHLFLFLQLPDDRNVDVEIGRDGGREPGVSFMNSNDNIISLLYHRLSKFQLLVSLTPLLFSSFIFFLNIFIGVKLLYSVVLVSAV